LCEAWLDDLALGFLANALRAWQVQPSSTQTWDGLPVNFQIAAGWTTMSLRSISRLKLHDVILLDECLIGGEEAQVMIRLGERWGVRGRLSGSTITITDWLDEIMNETDDFDEPDEYDDHEFESEATEDTADGLDKIPVRMHFDLGERVMTFAELRALAPGYVIELGREVRRSVAIRVNGRKIGEGELVDIDGYVGVSLLSVDPPSV
jgi:type III secretion protein Q